MLNIRNLIKTFFPNTPNEVQALRGVDLDIPEGCFAARSRIFFAMPS